MLHKPSVKFKQFSTNLFPAECQFIQCPPQTPAGKSFIYVYSVLYSCGAVNCSGTSGRAANTQPRDGWGWKGHLEVTLPNQGHPEVVAPDSFPYGPSVPHRKCLHSLSGHPARGLNCKKHKSNCRKTQTKGSLLWQRQ